MPDRLYYKLYYYKLCNTLLLLADAQVGEMLCKVPKDFKVHSDITRLLKQRYKAMETGSSITMPLAESLAFGSLILALVPYLFYGYFCSHLH